MLGLGLEIFKYVKHAAASVSAWLWGDNGGTEKWGDNGGTEKWGDNL